MIFLKKNTLRQNWHLKKYEALVFFWIYYSNFKEEKIYNLLDILHYLERKEKANSTLNSGSNILYNKCICISYILLHICYILQIKKSQINTIYERYILQDMVGHVCHISTRELEAGEARSSLAIINSRPAWATWDGISKRN